MGLRTKPPPKEEALNKSPRVYSWASFSIPALLQRVGMLLHEDTGWRERQEQFAQEQIAEMKRLRTENKIYFGVGVTLALIVATLLSAAIEAGWISPWFGLFASGSDCATQAVLVATTPY